VLASIWGPTYSSIGGGEVGNRLRGSSICPIEPSEEHYLSYQITNFALADARILLTVGEKQARELRIPYNVAVFDAAGAPISS